MNTLINLKKGTARNGVETPDGILYAVTNGEALEIWLKQDKKDFVKVVAVEHLTNANQLGVIVYDDVYDKNSEPQILLLDTEGKTDETNIIFNYVVHTLEVKDGKVENEYFEHFDDYDSAYNQFEADVICEKRAFDYDRTIGVEFEETEKSWTAYLKDKKATDYKLIEIEEIPELVRLIK